MTSSETHVTTSIPSQVRLPLRVALGVVAQGIRIRLGRSFVTITGVALGVAFLSSMLTNQILRRSVAAEDALRAAESRSYSFLVSETGPLPGRRLGAVLTAAPSAAELRLLQRLKREGVEDLSLFAMNGQAAPPGLPFESRPASSAEELSRDAVAVIVVGTGALPALDWDAVRAGTRQKVLALAAERGALPALAEGAAWVPLQRPLPHDEAAKLAAAARAERFRGLWIIAISVLVTVIGISNSMLMSVTERFRDIGTMKCLGAEARFIRTLFLLEASFMGVVGGAAGVLLGTAFSLSVTLAVYGPSLSGQAASAGAGALLLAGLAALVAGAVLSVVASLYPAQFAARMVPAAALRSNV